MDSALEEIQSILDDQPVRRETLASLESNLEVLDQIFPVREKVIRNNTMILGLKMLQEEREGRIMHKASDRNEQNRIELNAGGVRLVVVQIKDEMDQTRSS